MKKIITLILCLIGVISFIACDSKNETIQYENEPIIEQKETIEKTLITDLPYNDYNMVALEDVKIELGIFPMDEDFTPIKLYKEQPVILTDEEKQVLKQNLSDTIWEDITFQETNYDGLFFIQNESENYHDDCFKNYELSINFIEKSGLVEIFKQKDIDFRIDELSKDSFATFYREYKDGEYMTNSYIRLNFDQKGNIAECKVYAMQSEHYKTIDRIYVDDAINNPCFAHYHDAGILKQKDRLEVVGARVTYSHLVPLYAFTVKTDNSTDKYEIYTPCISNQEILNNEISYSQFLSFMTNGVLR